MENGMKYKYNLKFPLLNVILNDFGYLRSLKNAKKTKHPKHKIQERPLLISNGCFLKSPIQVFPFKPNATAAPVGPSMEGARAEGTPTATSRALLSGQPLWQAKDF